MGESRNAPPGDREPQDEATAPFPPLADPHLEARLRALIDRHRDVLEALRDDPSD